MNEDGSVIYPTNAPTFSFLHPHQKVSPTEKPPLYPPQKCTQKNNLFQNKLSRFSLSILSPYSLKSNGPDCVYQPHRPSPRPVPEPRLQPRPQTRPRFDPSLQ
jgi:hypothetical protein